MVRTELPPNASNPLVGAPYVIVGEEGPKPVKSSPNNGTWGAAPATDVAEVPVLVALALTKPDFFVIPDFFAVIPTAAKFVSFTVVVEAGVDDAVDFPKEAKKSSSSMISFKPPAVVAGTTGATGGVYAVEVVEFELANAGAGAGAGVDFDPPVSQENVLDATGAGAGAGAIGGAVVGIAAETG